MITTLNPIGLFDSGVGGTSIWKEINKLLPQENTIYLADSKNAPYGQKTKEEIIHLSCKNTEFLLNLNSKIIVVACNTATTNAIKVLREKYDIPFIGIEPAIKPAAIHTKTHKIGILATKGTLNSELFHETVSRYTNIEVMEQIGYGLVDLIENGEIDSNETMQLLEKYLEPMITNKMDFLVLGCSHYPYLIPQIKKILPNNIAIIDSGEAVAKQTKLVLEKNKLINLKINEGENIFYSNGNPKILSDLIQRQDNIFYRDF
jgi:glutamate racemase